MPLEWAFYRRCNYFENRSLKFFLPAPDLVLSDREGHRLRLKIGKDMFEKPKDHELNSLEHLVSSSSEVKIRKRSIISERANSINVFHALSASLQIFLGLVVVALSLLQNIQPLWLATLMTVLGCITTMVGIYFIYTILSKSAAFDNLLHQSINRVINSQN